MEKRARFSKAMLGAAALAAAIGCAQSVGDIDRTQPNAVRKELFGGVWYFRETITDVPATSSFTFIGETSGMEKIRWEITEDKLIGYRAYEAVPGTDVNADPVDKAPGSTRYRRGLSEGRNGEYKENPVVAFAITGHFDITRSYNPQTGEQSNVMSENTTDRPWYQRKYMRVDWTKNIVTNFLFTSSWASQVAVNYVQQSEGGDDAFYAEDSQGNVLGAENAIRHAKDLGYFDFTSKLFVTPDLWGCILSFYGQGYEDCTSAEVKIRMSFAKVAAESEYEPLPYSDKDQAKFGYFRTERITYNRDRGATESGRIYLANRHPMWKESYVKGSDGKHLRVCSSAFRATTQQDRERGALDLTKDSSYFRAGVHLAEYSGSNAQPLAICKGAIEAGALGAVTLPANEGQDYQLTDESFFVAEGGKVLVKKFVSNGQLFEYPGSAPVRDVKANLVDPCEWRELVWVRLPAKVQAPFGAAKLGCLRGDGAKVVCDDAMVAQAYRSGCLESELVKASMPFSLREPKPVVYHASVHHPVQLIPSLENIAKSWNRAFRKSVALAMGKSEESIPDMFVLDLNGYDEFQTPKDLSNDQWVDRRAIAGVSFDESAPSERWANGNRVGRVVVRYNRLATDDDGTVDADRRALRCREFDTVGENKYYAECVSNASYTSDGTRTRIFTFNPANVKVRIGDVRKNVIWWVDSPQLYSPWGYGPSAADPETGEIISGTAYVYGAPTDTIATQGLDIIKLLNNKLKIQDLIDGTAVRDHIMANLERVDPRHMVGETTSFKELSDHEDLLGKAIGQKTVNRINSLKQAGLPEGYRGWLEGRMMKIKGTPLADMMMNHEEVRQAAGINPFDQGAVVTPRQKEKMESAVYGLPAMMRKNKERIAKASKNNIWLAEFGDDAIRGLALEFANKYNQQYELSSMEEQAKIDREVWGEIRTRIYRAVTEHEVGHTLGLRHNFQGSFDSLNFFDEYWRLRQQTLKGPEAGAPDSLVRFNGNRVAGYNLNHALEQATFTDEQKIGKMREFQYSTVMDYGARLNSDIHGTGKYDDAAIVYAYTGQTRVTPKSDILTESQLYPLRPGTSSNRFYCQNGALAAPVGRDEWRCVDSGYVEIFDSAKLPISYAKLPKLLQTYNDRPAPVFKSLTEMVHYSQLPYLMGGGKLQGICRGNTKCDVCYGAEDDTAAGQGAFEGMYAFRLKSMFACDATKDLQTSVVEGGDATKGLEVLKARSWARGNEVRRNKTLVEVPYLFCGDEYVGSTGNCNRWDEGADAFEITKNVIDTYENYYFFNNFKRDRYGFDSQDVLMRVYGRYFTVLPNVYQNWLFAQFSEGFGFSHAILDAIGAFDGFNLLTSVLTRPRYGTHFEANNQWYSCTYQMKNVKDCGNPDAQGNPRRPVTSVPMGAGRRFFTRYDYTSGYNMYDKVLESGHYWEVIAALFAIAESEATVVGADTSADFRTFLLPYFLIFPDELTHYYNSVILEDNEAVGSRLSPQPDGTAKVFSIPGYDYVANYVDGTNPTCTANAADPRPFRRCTLNPPAGLKFSRLGVSWMQRIYTLYLGMAGFTSFLSVPYPDQAKVFKLGAGEAVQAGDGYTAVEFTNPKRGFRYAALSRNGVTETRKKTLGVRNVEIGKALYDRWVAETDPNTKADLENQIDSVSDDLDLLRWMYDIYGRAW